MTDNEQLTALFEQMCRAWSDGDAVLYGTGSVRVTWRSQPPRRRLTRNTMVAVRTAAGWRPGLTWITPERQTVIDQCGVGE